MAKRTISRKATEPSGEDARPKPADGFSWSAGDDLDLLCFPNRFHTVAEIRSFCQELRVRWLTPETSRRFYRGNATLHIRELWRAMRLLPGSAPLAMPNVTTIEDALGAVDLVVGWCNGCGGDEAHDTKTGATDRRTIKPTGANRGGRPRKWDELWVFIQEQEQITPKPKDATIANSYNRKYGSQIGQGFMESATAKTVVDSRYNHKSGRQS